MISAAELNPVKETGIIKVTNLFLYILIPRRKRYHNSYHSYTKFPSINLKPFLGVRFSQSI
jgi:hypothetical protein